MWRICLLPPETGAERGSPNNLNDRLETFDHNTFQHVKISRDLLLGMFDPSDPALCCSL